MDDLDFTQERPAENRVRTLAKAYSQKPKNKFGAPELVFMHVGKTGGTTINTFFRNCHDLGLRVPIVLNHNWSFQMTRLRYPKAKIIVVLRDPLERFVSGFNSRLREGRPLGHPWRNDEAIAFSHFNNAKVFVDALSSNDHYDISAALYCFRTIDHLRRGYRYSFEGLHNNIEKSDRFLQVIRIEDIGNTIHEVVANLNTNKINKIPSIRTAHQAPVSSGSFLKKISEENLKKIHSRMQLEYETYHLIESYSGNS